MCSALTGEGVDAVWSTVERFMATMKTSGALEERRRQQTSDWLDDLIRAELLRRFFHDPTVRRRLTRTRAAVMSGEETVVNAARLLLEAFDHHRLRSVSAEGAARGAGDVTGEPGSTF